ncbi:MAG: exosortase system-associated protein, TIGR04073 family [Candidatus Omnitrophica bacterium]|nr:exosortase system-associated protein, TIGR04073 family [Candidatus Omnitrophota bacterium]
MKLGIMGQRKWFVLVAVMLCSSILVMGCAHSSKTTSKETALETSAEKVAETPDLSTPHQSYYSAALSRLNSGFINIVTGPIELVSHVRTEVQNSDPLQGFIPGVVKGITWFGIREVVGAFEVVTFLIPWKPHLKPVDLEWVTI